MSYQDNNTKKPSKSTSAIQTVLNNLEYARGTASDARHALFVINTVCSLCGYRKQRLAARMILDGYRCNPEFDSIRKAVNDAWDDICRREAQNAEEVAR